MRDYIIVCARQGMSHVGERVALSAAASLVLLAGAHALGQVTEPPVPPAMPVGQGMIQGGDYVTRGPYSPRGGNDVYAVGIPSVTGGAWASSSGTVYDDATFQFGWCQAGTRTIDVNSMALGFIVPANATPQNDHLFTRVSFYPDHDGTVAAGLTPYSGQPVMWNLDWGAGWSAAAGFISYYADPVAFNSVVQLNPGNVFGASANDATCGVKIELFMDAAMTVRAGPLGYSIVRRANHTSLSSGQSDAWSWFGEPANGELLNSTRGGSSAFPRATYMAFGTGFVECHFPGTDLGCLADGIVTSSGVVANQGVRWYRFCLPGNATDSAGAAGQFLDLDTEGSNFGSAIAIFDGEPSSAGYGNVIASDEGSGSGNQSQLSFGIGRRAAVGDGKQYDGRGAYGGTRGLPSGRYYVAFASAGATFMDGFNVISTGTGGSGTLNLRTNVNGAPLAASVRPLAYQDLGTPYYDSGIALGVPAAGEVRWVRFSTCRDADAEWPVTINLNGTNAPSSSITLFNSSGQMVGQSNSTTPTLAAPLVFSTTGSLPAGEYDLAITYGSPHTVPGGRWHLRNSSQAQGFTFAGNLYVGWATCPTCTPDFNGDGDFGTDADIEAFFACLGGDCCPRCGSADFNGDGDTGTDADIESFFRVLGGGAC